MKPATIVFKNETVQNLDDFKKGDLYTHKVYNGLAGDFDIGIQCYDFSFKDFDFLKTFKYIGNLSINKEKITFGGGSVFNNSMFFNVDLNNIELTKADYKKELLVTILQ